MIAFNIVVRDNERTIYYLFLFVTNYCSKYACVEANLSVAIIRTGIHMPCVDNEDKDKSSIVYTF